LSAGATDVDPVLARMLAHRSIRTFAPEPIPDAAIERAVRAAQSAATSHLVQSYALLRIRSAATRTALATIAGGQPHVATAGAFFVVLGDQHRHRQILAARGLAYAANLETFLLAAIDAALFAQNLALAFEALGYGICYVGGLRNDLGAVDTLLGTPPGALPLFGLCVGVPAEDPVPIPRLPLEAVLFEERYPEDAALEHAIAQYDAQMGRWHAEQRGKSGRDWSGQIVRLFSAPQRSAIGDFYRAKGAVLR